MKKRSWSGRPNNTSRQTVYSYQRKDGDCDFVEAVSSVDARKHIRGSVKIYRRDLEHSFYFDAIFSKEYRQAIFYGATTKEEADDFLKSEQNRTKTIKPTKQMLKDMALLSRAKEIINPDEQFRLKIPGGAVLNTTGSELLKTADHFSELLNAAANGNEKNISKAVTEIMENGINVRH